ncbi:MAG: integrase arm-type DNA-binding domain-containing protein [Usitatibacter sp.]
MAGSDFLTDRAVQNAKPKAAAYKLTDGRGMYLLVKPDGAKYWRLKYRYAGKEKLLSLGVYPDVKLKSARTKRDAAREQVAAGLDPSVARKAEKRLQRISASNTFEAIALEWHGKQKAKWSEAHADAVLSRLERDLFPSIGREPIASVSAQVLLEALRKIEARGALELLSKSRVVAGQVFRYAIATARATSDPTVALRGAFEQRETRNYARLHEPDLPEFLKKLEGYEGTRLTKLAIKLLALTFVRTGELRGARWPEFNFEEREWHIPAERMKGGSEHIVPLSDQAIAVLREIEKLSGDEDFSFPNEHHAKKPMSENTILFALYRMGYRGRATGHGFRATASTILNGVKKAQGRTWNADVIERQLAHKEANKIRAAYHHTQYLEERATMMQWWADYLDAKRAEGEAEASEEKVPSLQRKRA